MLGTAAYVRGSFDELLLDEGLRTEQVEWSHTVINYGQLETWEMERV
jgi:hypothetical protein